MACKHKNLLKMPLGGPRRSIFVWRKDDSNFKGGGFKCKDNIGSQMDK